MRRLSRLLGTIIERHSAWLVVGVALVTAVAVFGALRVEMRTSQDMLISTRSQVYQDYMRLSRQFGGDQIFLLLSGDPDALLSESNLSTMAELQRELLADPKIKLVISPVTFLKAAAEQVAALQGADAAAARALSRDPQFVRTVVFGPGGEVNPQLTRVIPDDRHVAIGIRLAGDLTLDEQKAAAKHVRKLVESHDFSGEEALLAGTPLLMQGITDRMQQSMMLTGALAVVLMVLVLFVVFRARWPLLSLPIVLIGVLCTFGVMGFVSLPITLVTMAGLPILIGLGVDYAIQFHNRYEEEVLRGDTPAAAVIDAITHIGPAVGIAVFATALGFIVLLISQVPMIRHFGIMLAIGVVILYLAGFFLLNSILYQRDKGRSLDSIRRGRPSSMPQVERFLTALAKRAIRYPLAIVVVAVVFSGVGLYLDRHLPVQTDIEKLAPPSTPELIDLNRARDIVGTTTEISILVEAEDVTSPDVLNWMLAYQDEQLREQPDLLTADSPATAVVTATGGDIPPPAQVDQILDGLPEPVRDSLVTADRRAAVISFGVELIPMDQMNTLIEEMAADARPPAGATAVPAGIATLGARTVTALTANRELVTLAGLLAIAAGLTLVYRSVARALVPILPIALIVGWSAAFMYAAGIDLNPLTAVLGSLIIGIGVEFTVLLMERYYEEKAKGQEPREAMITAVSRIGRAISASGLTVVAGFGTLMASDFPVLQDFGKVVVIDVLLALVCTLVILPAVIVWLDGRVPSARTALGMTRALALRALPLDPADRRKEARDD